MALTIANFLKTVQTRKYQQALGVEQYPTAIIDGVPTGWHNVLFVGKFTETEYVFEGVPASIANNLPPSVVAADASGNSHTVSFADAVQVQGANLVETLSNRVSKVNITPRLWRIVVLHKEGEVLS